MTDNDNVEFLSKIVKVRPSVVEGHHDTLHNMVMQVNEGIHHISFLT